ncbi:MAG: hypothetical protein LC747_08845, partial [Acidobacteria bacterium]|nr:hypothetical protein [Acidobacteriota bacterium]
VNVARIAEKFGGGGHRNAAGCTLTGNWDETESNIVALLVEAVENGSNGNGNNNSASDQTPTVGGNTPTGQLPPTLIRGTLNAER